MLTNSMKLKGKIVENGFTITSLANELGISKATLSQKVNNKIKFSQPDIKQLVNKLNLNNEEIKEIFLN